MVCTRRIVLKHSTSIVKLFTEEVLKSMYNDFHIYCWNNGLNFNKFKGHDLSMFVFKIKKVITFSNKYLMITQEINNLLCGLDCLQDVFSFLSISYINDKNEYMEEIRRYEEKVKLLFKYGKDSYLSNENGGVTFYFHVLRFYYPKFAKMNANNHNLGMGIFSMQGFERRNKESKNTLKRFCTTNRSSSHLIVNNIRRLLYVFMYENNAY